MRGLATILALVTAVAAAGCGSAHDAGGGGDGDGDSDGAADAGVGGMPCTSAAPGLDLADISARSPDLAASPYGGAPGWDASDKYAPGVALVDLDGDGALDLVQPRNDRANPALRGLRVHRGAGDGSFTDVTDAPGAGLAWDPADNATVALAFDADGDDDLDLFVGVDGGPSRLYRNDGSGPGSFQFTEIGAAAGVAAPGVRVFTAAAGDADGDGDLDLYLGAWNASAPDHGDGTSPNLLLENDGAGHFTDVTAAAGVACHGRATLGLAFADLDGDADLDLFVANDFFPACLYENLGDGRFAEVAAAAHVAGGAIHGMGVAVGDLDGDADLDLFVTDDEVLDDSRGNAVYLNESAPGALAFRSVAPALGLDGLAALDEPPWLVSWGVGLVDLDLDGRLDVHTTTHGERAELFWQQRCPGVFTVQSPLMASLADVDGRGSAYGDLDADGDLDLVVARRGAGLQVLENRAAPAAWIAVAPRPLSAAPGARVAITAAGRTQVTVVQAGSSYLSTSPPAAHFGLGALPAATPVLIEVRFPDDTVRTAEATAGTVLTIEP